MIQEIVERTEITFLGVEYAMYKHAIGQVLIQVIGRKSKGWTALGLLSDLLVGSLVH